jgi:hypothetical protein
LKRIIIVGDDLDFLLNLPRDRLLTHCRAKFARMVQLRADGAEIAKAGAAEFEF